jgi:hypothetical protein
MMPPGGPRSVRRRDRFPWTSGALHEDILKRHGEQIMALISGKGYQYRGCMADGFYD